MIKIDFEFETEIGMFRDALYLPDDHQLNDQEINQLKESRRDKWVESVKNAPSPIPNSITINEEPYMKLEGIPPSGAEVIEVDGFWYYKV